FCLLSSLPIYTLFPYTTLFRSHLHSWFPAFQAILLLLQFRVLTVPVPPHNQRSFSCTAPCSDHPGRNLHRAGEAEYPDQPIVSRSEEHTSELQSRFDLVCRLLL